MNKCIVFAVALFAVGVNSATLPGPNGNKISSDSGENGGLDRMKQLVEEVVERTSFAIGMKLITAANVALAEDAPTKQEYAKRGKRDILDDIRSLLKKNFGTTSGTDPSNGYWRFTTPGPYPTGGYGSGFRASSGYGPYPTGGYGSGFRTSSGYGPYPTGGYGSGFRTSSGYGPYPTGGYGSGFRTSSGYGPYSTGGYGSGFRTSSGYGPYPTGGYGSGTSSGYGPYPTGGYGSGFRTSSGYGPYPTGGYGSGFSSTSDYGSYSTGGYRSFAISKRKLDDDEKEKDFRVIKMIGEILVG